MLELRADLQSVQWGDRLIINPWRAGAVFLPDSIVGQLVLVDDGEGQTCVAVVTARDGDLIETRLVLPSWRSVHITIDRRAPLLPPPDALYQVTADDRPARRLT